MKLEPGMVFEHKRIDHVMAVVLLSKEPGRDWVTAAFQSYRFGAAIEVWPESTILKWQYKGTISEFDR